MAHDHSIQGELKATGLISLEALADIQPGEEREMDIPVGTDYLKLPALMNGKPEVVGVDIIHVRVRRPD